MTDPNQIIRTAGEGLSLLERILAIWPTRRRRAKTTQTPEQQAVALRRRADQKRAAAARALTLRGMRRKIEAAELLEAAADKLAPRPVGPA
jgi:hypothetical protein